MTDREKVIKGLECLTNEDPYMSTIACAEKKCPYAVIPDCNFAIWHDALELLKEQEPVKPRTHNGGGKSPTWWYVCGACGHAIDPKDKFCRECGRKVKWNE